MNDDYIGLDFETYSDVDLRKHGHARYFGSPHFQPLIGSTTLEDGTEDSLELVLHDNEARDWLGDHLSNRYIVAHNAGFERTVLRWYGLEYPSTRFIDSAVIARAAGADGHLVSAAPQLLNTLKGAMGADLIKVFSIPGKYQEANGNVAFDPQVIEDRPQDWLDFIKYCQLDSTLGLRIQTKYHSWITPQEFDYMALTLDMNDRGWPVDIASVEEMYRRYLENLEMLEAGFRTRCQAPDLNLNSLPQMKAWCAERGVKATSFDEKHVAQLIQKISDKLLSSGVPSAKRIGYEQVLDMLAVKQSLGGSSLKKLAVILDTAHQNGNGARLYDQYVHCGAGQTLRTSGRSVQMQNLKRLSGVSMDMDDLMLDTTEFTNEEMAGNMRQLFTSSHPQGRLLVGDFSSVEARGLAWLAGEAWKLNAFRNGQDLYKVSAARQFSLAYEAVTKDQRMFGKLGELSCGYQAGAGAVKDFAEKMGVILTEAEAMQIVTDWRLANPRIVEFWEKLGEMLRTAVSSKTAQHVWLFNGLQLSFAPVSTPQSLIEQVGSLVQSIQMRLHDSTGTPILKRVFHGCYSRGGNVGYFKPTSTKGGELWSNTYVHPKSKQRIFRQLYGGKVAGILTQSLCREIFFDRLHAMSREFGHHSNLTLVGQFHDEVVSDWIPDPKGLNRNNAETLMHRFMSTPPDWAKGFPLAAVVSSSYRYIK